MKTKHLGLEITSVPGVEYIRVEPSERPGGSVRVLLKLPGVAPASFGLDELLEFIKALTQAENHGRFMADQNARGDDE